MRISGVNVGKVQEVEPNERDRADRHRDRDRRALRAAPARTRARSCARRRCSARPTWSCRPGAGATATRLSPTAASCRSGQVAETVELDEIFRTFDPETRAALLAPGSTSRAGRRAATAEAINDALGNLTPFAEDTDDVLEVLDAQSGATRRLVRDTGEVFEALTERQGQLRELIVNSNRVWQGTASRDEELAETFRVLPDLPARGAHHHRRLTAFAAGHQPADRPAAPGGARALADARSTSTSWRPTCAAFFNDLGPLVRGLAQRPARHRAGARQHAAAAGAGSTRSCASSRRSSTTSASTSARSPPSSPTTRPSTQADGPAPQRAPRLHYLRTRTRSTPRSWRPTRTGSPPTARTPTPSRAATTSSPGPALPGVRQLPLHRDPGAARRRRSSRSCPTERWSAEIDSSSSAAPQNVGAAPPCEAQAPLGRDWSASPGATRSLQPLPQ